MSKVLLSQRGSKNELCSIVKDLGLKAYVGILACCRRLLFTRARKPLVHCTGRSLANHCLDISGLQTSSSQVSFRNVSCFTAVLGHRGSLLATQISLTNFF